MRKDLVERFYFITDINFLDGFINNLFFKKQSQSVFKLYEPLISTYSVMK